MSVSISVELQGINDIKSQLSGLSDSLKDSMKGAQEATTSTSTSMGKLTTAIKAAAVAFGLWKLSDYAKDSAMLSARVETLGVVLNTIGTTAGYSTKELSGFVSGVSAMGITTQESLQSLTKMVQANLDLTKATQLARVAQDAAVIANTNSSDAMGRLLHGITTLQPEILRNLGIVVNFQQAYQNFAAASDRSVESLTQAEKQQIAMNAVLKEGEKIAGSYENAMGTVGKQLTSLPRYTEELSLKFGELFKPALGVAVGEFTELLGSVSDALVGMKEAGDLKFWASTFGNTMYTLEFALFSVVEAIEETLLASKALYKIMSKPWTAVDVYNEWKKALNETRTLYDNTFTHLAERANKFNDAMEAGPQTLKRSEVQKVLDELAKSLRDNTDKAIEMGKGFNKTSADIKLHEEALKQLKALGLDPTAGAVLNVKEKLKELQTTPQMAATKKILDDLAKTLKFNSDEAIVFGKEFNKVEADTKAVHKAIDSLLQAGLKPTSQAVQDLKTKFDAFSTTGERSAAVVTDIENKLGRFGFAATENAEAAGTAFSLLNPRIEETTFKVDEGALAFFGLGATAVQSLDSTIIKQEELGQTVVTITSMIQTATEGVATAVKSLWSDTTMTVNDAWHNALDVFVDVMTKMVAQAITTGAAINIQMAVATSGITLVVGLLASIFGGGGGGGGTESTVEKSTKAFLKSIRSTLISFEEEILGTLKHLTNIAGRTSIDMSGLQHLTKGYKDLLQLSQMSLRNYYGGKNPTWSWKSEALDIANKVANEWRLLTGKVVDAKDILNDIQSYTNQFTDMIFDNLSNIKDALIEEYNIRKRVASDTIALYQKQQDFLKGMTTTITGVKRALFTDTELFSAQTKDIDALKASLAGLTGEKKLTVIEDLKGAYLEAWGTAQKLFAGDTANLLKWQEFTVKGLEELQQSGKSAYDKLIDVNLEILGIQKTGVDIETQMLTYTKKLSGVVEQTLLLLEQIGLGGVSAITPEIMNKLSGYLQSVGFAKGGFIDKPTYAMMGEAGQELVLPLTRPGRTAQLLNQAGLLNNSSGGVVVQNMFYGPVVWDEISASQYAKKQAKLIHAEYKKYV